MQNMQGFRAKKRGSGLASVLKRCTFQLSGVRLQLEILMKRQLCINIQSNLSSDHLANVALFAPHEHTHEELCISCPQSNASTTSRSGLLHVTNHRHEQQFCFLKSSWNTTKMMLPAAKREKLD